jgi:hypothetical protein
MLTKVTNYVKLSVRAERILDDATSIPRPTYRLKDGRASYVTTWTFPCSDGAGSEVRAFAAALDKRRGLRQIYPDLPAVAFQLSGWERTAVRGMYVVGKPIRIPLRVVDEADDRVQAALDRFLAGSVVHEVAR